MSEEQRLTEHAGWYLESQLDIDRRALRARYRAIRPHLRGPAGLELGPAEGEMTPMLLDDFAELTIVEGAQALLDLIPSNPRLRKVHSVFEDFQPIDRFDTIVMEHILEHVVDPGELLRRARTWLTPGGRIIAGVPNALSIHRQAAVKMKLLAGADQLNERDLSLGHRRVYTLPSLVAEFERAALATVATGGVMLKPLSYAQMQEHWTESMIDAFIELGTEFPAIAAEIYAVGEPVTT